MTPKLGRLPRSYDPAIPHLSALRMMAGRTHVTNPAPNWFTHKTDYRFDWTRSAYYKLSDKTKEICRHLAKPVQVIMFYKPMTEGDARLHNDLQNLMKEYENQSKNIKF